MRNSNLPLSPRTQDDARWTQKSLNPGYCGNCAKCTSGMQRFGDHRDESSASILTVDQKQPFLSKIHKTTTDTQIVKYPPDLITINVSGRKFVIDRCYLLQYPTTLLGSPEIEKYWDSRYKEYFFDTHRDAFESIFDFYLYGKLYPHPNVPSPLHYDNVQFFKIMTVFEMQDKEDDMEEEVEMSCYSEIKTQIYNTLEDPQNHLIGKIYGWADLFFIFLSILTLLIETIPSIHKQSTTEGSTISKVFFTLETLTVAFFTFDVLIRCFAAPDRLKFVKSPATWLDILTVAPFYVELFVDFSRLESMKVLRIARVVRVLKLIKRNKRLQLIAEVLIKSMSELVMLVIVWVMNITVAGIILYYVEERNNDLVQSGTDGMWWAIVTMSTVGYGDIYPVTVAGKFIATVFIWMSMVFLALPLTIIVSTFNRQYDVNKTLTLKRKGGHTKEVPEMDKE